VGNLLNTKASGYDIAAWVLIGLLMVLVLLVHLLAAMLAGLLVFELVQIITPYVERKFPGPRAKFIVIALIAISVVGLLTLATMGITSYVTSDSGSVQVLLTKMAEIIEYSRQILPEWLDKHLPQNAITLQQMVTEWLREHAVELQFVGKEAGRYFAQILIGMIIGGMIALHDIGDAKQFKPFERAMVERVNLFSKAFKNIVFAQVRISAINATLTGIYLVVVLPLLGINLPLAKTLIAITFLVGLLPVVGNLISNTMIVVVSMSQSLNVALGSLLFLVVIHKLEYFLNARIVGGQIRAKAWELLIAMLVMEATFGIVGIVAAPIYYAYIKSELKERALV